MRRGTSREERRLKVLGGGGEGKQNFRTKCLTEYEFDKVVEELHNKKLHSLYRSANIFRITKNIWLDRTFSHIGSYYDLFQNFNKSI